MAVVLRVASGGTHVASATEEAMGVVASADSVGCTTTASMPSAEAASWKA